MSNPRLCGLSCLEVGPRVAHALVPYRKPPSKPRVICAPITDAFSVAYLSQIADGMYRDLEDGFRLRYSFASAIT